MEKIASICWNINHWKQPSGIQSKSKEKNTSENEKCFGHKEWLLNDSKILTDGYHYAFLGPINKQFENMKAKHI